MQRQVITLFPSFFLRYAICAVFVFARRMLRQAETLCELAFALGGKVGEQIPEKICMTLICVIILFLEWGLGIF